MSEVPTSKKKEFPKPKGARPTDPEWQQLVMSKFLPDEMVDGNPTVDGLRRVAELLINTIEGEFSEVILCLPERTVVKARVKFVKGKTIEAVAEVNPTNCQEEYMRYAVSTCETRARGRCFRVALKLRKTLAAEEIGGETKPSILTRPREETIASVQVTAIKMLASRMKLGLSKVLTAAGISKSDLATLTYDEGTTVVQFLNGLQGKDIPAELLEEGATDAS